MATVVERFIRNQLILAKTQLAASLWIPDDVLDGAGFAIGTSAAAANDLTLSALASRYVITGNTQINGLALTDLGIVTLFFTGTPTVKHNTAPSAGFQKFKLMNNVDFVAQNGAALTLQYDGTDWKEVGRMLPSYLATETLAALIRLATTAEAIAATSDVGAMTPLKVQAKFALGTTAAAANDLTLLNDGIRFVISGNTTVNGISLTAMGLLMLEFTGTPLLKHDTAPTAGFKRLKLAGAVDMQAAAGDTLILFYDGTDYQEVGRKKAATEASLGSLKLATQALTNASTDDTTAVTPLKLDAKFGVGTTAAAANDLTLAGDGQRYVISGNTQINGLAETTLGLVTLIFTGTPTVKHDTAPTAGWKRFKLAGNVDFVAQAGSILSLVYDGTDWQEIGRKHPVQGITDTFDAAGTEVLTITNGLVTGIA